MSKHMSASDETVVDPIVSADAIGEAVMRYLEERDHKKTIGNMNGPWAVTLKLALVLMPILILWTLSFGVWTVNNIHGLEVKLAEKRDDPPRWLIDRIDKIDAAIADLRTELITQKR